MRRCLDFISPGKYRLYSLNREHNWLYMLGVDKSLLLSPLKLFWEVLQREYENESEKNKKKL